jgi:hypothetical protein
MTRASKGARSVTGPTSPVPGSLASLRAYDELPFQQRSVGLGRVTSDDATAGVLFCILGTFRSS